MELVDFIVKAKKQTYASGNPARKLEGDFEYINESEGTLDNFKGTERILFKGEDVYRLEYHGGKV